MELFKLEPGLMIWTWITFGALLLFLYKFVFPHLIEGMKLREETIANSITNAEKIETRLNEIHIEENDIRALAKKEADHIRENARNEAREIREQLIKKAHKEASDIINAARNRLEQEKKEAFERMHEELADIICTTSGQLVDHSFSSEDEKNWARELVEQL